MNKLLLASLLALGVTASETSRASCDIPPRIDFKFQVRFAVDGHREFRRLPVVHTPGRPLSEALVNADLEVSLGGNGFFDVPTAQTVGGLQYGDSLEWCDTSTVTRDLVAFRCASTSMGAHPYEQTRGLAYDLRIAPLRSMKARDLFTDAGTVYLANAVAMRAKADLLTRGVMVDALPRVEPFVLYPDHIEVTYDRCSLGACIYGGTTVRISCGEATAWLRPGAVWSCTP